MVALAVSFTLPQWQPPWYVFVIYSGKYYLSLDTLNFLISVEQDLFKKIGNYENQT